MRIKQTYKNDAPRLTAPATDYARVKFQGLTLPEVTFNMLNENVSGEFSDLSSLTQAIENEDLDTLRNFSNYYFKKNGVYKRLTLYLSNLYCFDIFTTPYIGVNKINEKTLLKEFYMALNALESLKYKKLFTDIALNVIKQGCYYCDVDTSSGVTDVQELPVDYCRSRFNNNGRPVVEFNLKYFDKKFRNKDTKLKILKMFSKEIQRGYLKMSNGNLDASLPDDRDGWLMLGESAFKFSLSGENDIPFFITLIPALINLEEIKGLEKKKLEQQLYKLIIQRLPLTKEGDMIFNEEEGAIIHQSAKQMVGSASGLDIFTTYADVAIEDISNDTRNKSDNLLDAERGVYNDAGVSANQFNTSGNLALEKSTQNDVSLLNNLVYQLEELLDYIVLNNTKKNKIKYSTKILKTTIFNFKEISKSYKEQMQLGYSKMLAQIALGRTQLEILETAKFENDILKLNELFIPPMTSNTMSSDTQKKIVDEDKAKGGREELPDDKKSEKTIANGNSSK